MRRITIGIIISCIITMVSCATHKPDWPQYVYDSIWIPKQANAIRYAHEGVYKVFYKIDVCYPAKELIDEMVTAMTTKGWKRLDFDPLRDPEKIPLSHMRSSGKQWSYGLDMDYGKVYGWKECWEDKKGNVVSYAFKYKLQSGKSIENTCSLNAYTSFISHVDLQTLLKLFRETPIVVPENVGIGDDHIKR